jgi:hypothetical protein
MLLCNLAAFMAIPHYYCVILLYHTDAHDDTQRIQPRVDLCAIGKMQRK